MAVSAAAFTVTTGLCILNKIDSKKS